jgi:hypothetical protein
MVTAVLNGIATWLQAGALSLGKSLGFLAITLACAAQHLRNGTRVLQRGSAAKLMVTACPTST